MEGINRVILRGIAGSATIQPVGSSSVARFPVRTDVAMMNLRGETVIETTWHQVCAWQGVRMPNFLLIKDGTAVTVEGRLKNVKYIDPEGAERNVTEILASAIRIEEPDGN